MPDNNNQFGDFLSQAGQQATGAALGLVLGKHNDRRQFKQATKLGHLQLGLNKLQMDYNMQKQLEMWAATGPQAQMEQLRKAGLNPGLIYGMGGAGGQSASVAPGNISSGGAAGHTGEAIAMASTAAQLGLMRAQKENIEADTENKKADIPVKQATVPKLQEETKLTTAERQLKEGEVTLQQANMDNLHDEIYYRVIRASQEVSKLARENEIDETTKSNRIQGIIDTAIGIALNNDKIKADTTKTGVETDKIRTEATQLVQKLLNETQQVAIQQQLADFETKFGKQFGGILSTVLQAIRGRR